jgi:pimeloyl-ACP methyl ester carboxylesterase
MISLLSGVRRQLNYIAGEFMQEHAKMRKSLKWIVKTSFIAIASLALIGCMIIAELFFGVAPLAESRSRADVSLPELSGSYPVGRRFLDWVDPSRSDPFHKSAKRELVVSIWYPAQITGANQKETYLPGDWGLSAARVQSMMMRVRVQSFRSALLRNPLPREFLAGIKTHAVDNAAVSREKPIFPVLLFLPGFGAMATEYTAVLEDIASHGYVVVAINPTDFAPVTVFENGRTVYAPVWNISLYDLEKDYLVWVQDFLFVLNEVSRENKDPQSPLFERLDMTRVGAFGHSFGGAASAGACHSDSRIGAGLNLDGAPHGDRSTWKFPQPFMLVQSGRRAYQDSADEEFYKSLTNGYRAVIKGSTHHAFTDEAMLPLPEDRRQALVGSVPGPRMVRMTSMLVCTFFDIFLQRKPSTLLKEISSQFPEVTIQTSTVNETAKHAQ